MKKSLFFGLRRVVCLGKPRHRVKTRIQILVSKPGFEFLDASHDKLTSLIFSNRCGQPSVRILEPELWKSSATTPSKFQFVAKGYLMCPKRLSVAVGS